MKKAVSFIVSIVMIISLIPLGNVSVNAVNYNPDAALDYAEENWNNGIELCAGFVSNCLTAGGIKIMERTVGNLYNAMKASYGTAYVLKTSGPYIYMSENVGKVAGGDPVFYYCDSCHSFQHAILCGGSDDGGRMTDYAHNNPHHNTTTYISWGCPECGDINWIMYSVHIPSSGNSGNVVAPNTLTIHYNANGGSVNSSKYKLVSDDVHKADGTRFAQKMTYDNPVSGGLVNASELGLYRTGYTFAGWGTLPVGDKVVDENNASLKPSAINSLVKSENCYTTLYAQWKLNTYTISFNANGGVGAPSAQTKTHGVVLFVSRTKPTRSGFEFAGWNTKADGTGTVYYPGGIMKNDASVTLYAMWSKTHVHTYERNVIKEPTCTSRGIVSFSCSCGEEYTQSIAAAGHNVVWVYESRPTIYSTGSKYKSCSVCNEKLSAMTTVAKSTGDVNGDGKINSMDALAILQQAIGSRNSIINETDFLNADVNGDGVLNSMDALTILKISTGGIKL